MCISGVCVKRGDLEALSSGVCVLLALAASQVHQVELGRPHIHHTLLGFLPPQNTSICTSYEMFCDYMLQTTLCAAAFQLPCSCNMLLDILIQTSYGLIFYESISHPLLKVYKRHVTSPTLDSMCTVKTAWLLELSLFMDVSATRRFIHPADST